MVATDVFLGIDKIENYFVRMLPNEVDCIMASSSASVMIFLVFAVCSICGAIITGAYHKAGDNAHDDYDDQDF